MTQPLSVDADLAVLKHRVNNIDQKFIALDGSIKDIERKLDDLLQLRSKGMGAFWLASLVFGTSLVGLIVTMINWMKA